MQIKLILTWLCVLVVLGLASACSDQETATQVVISIEADALLSEKLTRIEVESYDPEKVDASGKPSLVGKQPFDLKTEANAKGVTLPFSFGALKNKADAFLLVVIGFEGERAVVEQKARVGFVDGQSRTLTIHLSSDCYEKLCAERSTSEWFQNSCDSDNGMCSGVETPDTVLAGDDDAGTTRSDGSVAPEEDGSADGQTGMSGSNMDGGGNPTSDAGDASDATQAQLDGGDSAPKDSGAIIDAQPVSCGTLTCPATANCITTPTPQCQCKPGYQGSGTTCTNINDCTATSCTAPATCMDGVSAFTCACPTGYFMASATSCAPHFTSISSGGDSVGGGTNCARRSNGSVSCWGRNISGQFGNGTEQQINNVPVTVTALNGVVEMAVGSNFACARRSDNTVVCSGGNSRGQLGRGVAGDSTVPVQVSGLSGVAELAAGSEHACARRMNGTVACWGENASGQLGNGMTGNMSLTPVEVVGLTNAVEIAAGSYHSCARREAGGVSSVVCWGSNNSGQLGNGSTAGGDSGGNLVQVSAGTGPVLFNPIGLALGEWHSCALLMGGKVACWGSDNLGQVGSSEVGAGDSVLPVSVAFVSDAVEVAANRFYSCARRTDGSVTCWGGWPGATASPATMVTSGALEIGAGYWHTCVRKNDGNVVCWGENKYGQMGNGTTQSDTGPPVTTAAQVTAY